MDLRDLSVGFEQPPKLLVCQLRTQVSNKEVFHDVSPTDTCLIVGSCRSIRQEDEVERAASSRFRFSVLPSHPCGTFDVRLDHGSPVAAIPRTAIPRT